MPRLTRAGAAHSRRAHAVEVDKLGLEIWQLRRLLLFEDCKPRIGLHQRRPGFGGCRLGTGDAFHLDIAFDFERAEIADESA